MNFVLGDKDMMEAHEERVGVDLGGSAQPDSDTLGASGDGRPQVVDLLYSPDGTPTPDGSAPSPREGDHPPGPFDHDSCTVSPGQLTAELNGVSQSPLPENFLTGAALEVYTRLRERALLNKAEQQKAEELKKKAEERQKEEDNKSEQKKADEKNEDRLKKASATALAQLAAEKRQAEEIKKNTEEMQKEDEKNKSEEKQAEEKKQDNAQEIERSQEKALPVESDDLPWMKSKAFHALLDNSGMFPSRPGAEYLSDLRVVKKGSKIVHLRPTDSQFVFVGLQRFHLLLLVRSKGRTFQVWLRDPGTEETFVSLARNVDAVEAAPSSSKYSLESTRLSVTILLFIS